MSGKQKKTNSLDYKIAIDEFYEEFPSMRDNVMLVVKSDFPKLKDQLVATSKFLRNKNILDNDIIMQGFIRGQIEMYKYPKPMDISYSSDMGHVHLVYPRNENDTALEARNGWCGLPQGFNADYFPVFEKKFDDKEMWHRIALDHELGHSLTISKLYDMADSKKETFKNDKEFFQNFGSDSGHLLECAADAYSVIRHYQRYGEDSKFPEYIADIRVFGLVSSRFIDSNYTTTSAIDRVVEMNKAGQIMNLKPEECADIAMKIAFESTYSMVEIKAIKSEFKINKKQIFSVHPNYVVERLQSIGTKTYTPIVQQICMRLLDFVDENSPKEGEHSVNNDILSSSKTKVFKNDFENNQSLKNLFKQQQWKYKTKSLRRISMPLNNKLSP